MLETVEQIEIYVKIITNSTTQSAISIKAKTHIRVTAQTHVNARIEKTNTIKKQTFPIEVSNSMHCFAIKFRLKTIMEIIHVDLVGCALEFEMKRVNAGIHSSGVCNSIKERERIILLLKGWSGVLLATNLNICAHCFMRTIH